MTLDLAMLADVVRLGTPVALMLLLAASIFLGPEEPAEEPAEELEGIITLRKLELRPRRTLLLWLLSLLGLTSALEGGLLVLQTLMDGAWPERWILSALWALAGAVAFLGGAARAEWTGGWNQGWLKGIAWVSLVSEAFVGGIDISQAIHRTRQEGDGFPVTSSLRIVLISCRLLLLILLIFAVHSRIKTYVVPSGSSPTESLLAADDGSAGPGSAGPNSTSGKTYGTFFRPPSTAKGSGTNTPTADKDKNKMAEGWGSFFKRLWSLAPYLWPKDSYKLQALSVACIGLVISGRVLNAAIPFTLGKLLTALNEGVSPWKWFSIYIALRFTMGSGGFVSVGQNMMWMPVMQYSDRKMSQLCFDHLLNLSLAWHTKKKTGEVLRILDRGSSINSLFQLILFNIMPVFFDIIVALGVFFVLFGPALAAVIFVVMIAYVSVSVVLTSWRTQIRRAANERDKMTRGIHADVLMNFETVKNFTAEAAESERYRQAIEEYQQLEFRVIGSLNFLNLCQNLIMSLGLLIGSFIVANRVISDPTVDSSQYAVFLAYLQQIHGPLNNLGMIYRQLNQTMVDSEQLMQLLNEDLDIKDQPDAPELVVTDGVIEFQDVKFAYDSRREALKGISFTIPKGASVALVGESGSGKSTILRLLYRFYELTSGRILIDGQDISKVTQLSLRKAIGIVPQDSNSFNETIGYNIGYGKAGATQAEIEEAARAAQLHDRVLSFPDQYETRVGERGVRLSGGEKQRVSIARTILKNPPILLLDEATSALDSATEQMIQSSLATLLKGRSSLTIAHRLSTIVNSDLIVVLSEGEIVEIGSHAQLVAKGGAFAEMWSKQISSEVEQLVAMEAAVTAEVAEEEEAGGSSKKKA